MRSKRIMSGRRGAAYVMAVVALLVGITLSIAMLECGSGYYLGEESRNQKQTASNYAEAGVDYVYWRVHYKGLKVPLPADASQPTAFTVDSVQEGSSDASTMLITITGLNGRHRHTLTRTVLGALPYEYSLCVNDKIDVPRAIYNSSTPGGLRSNSNIKLDHAWTNCRSGAWSTTASITTKGIVTPSYPNSKPVAFPAIDYDALWAVKRVEFVGDKTFPYPYPFTGYPGGGVICVTGKATIGGIYYGNYTLVAKGGIVVNNDLYGGNSSSHLALITTENIDPSPAAGVIEGALYCHNSGGTAKAHLHGAGNKSIYGSIAADKFDTDDDVSFAADTGLNLQVMRQLRLPGL